MPSTDLPVDASDLDEDRWRAIAAEFAFAPDLTYLNTGSEGSVPRRMQAVLAESMATWAASPSYAFFDDPELDSAQHVNRVRMARFLGADPADLVLTDNTTMGLAMVLLGLPFEPGDEIVTTQHDHYSMLSPLYLLRERTGVKVIELPLPTPANSPADIVEAFRQALTPRTRAFCFSNITFTVGLRMPVADLCALARRNGVLTLIDGAHAVGMLDLDLATLGCDFYAGACHKWMNGPPGTGILYVRDAATNPWRLVPILSEAAMDVGPGVTVADALQKRANLDGPAFHTVARTADFIDAIGRRAIEARILQLSRQVEQRAIALWGEGCLFNPVEPPGREVSGSGLKAFVPSRDPARARDKGYLQDIVTRLVKEHGIWVLSTAFPVSGAVRNAEFNTLRVSTSFYNSPAQIDALFAALRDITRHSPG